MPTLAHLAIALLVCLPTLPSQGAPQGDSPVAFPGILPIIPEASGRRPVRETFVFDIDRNGKLTQDGRQLEYAQLRLRLGTFAAGLPDAKLAAGKRRISRGQVLARLHPELPFEALYRVMHLCVALEAPVYRLYLGVRNRRGGDELALPLFLPIDKAGGPEHLRVEIQLDYGRPPLDSTVLRDRLAATTRKIELMSKDKHQRPLASLVISAPMHAAVASVLRIAYTARRVGFDAIAFSGGTPNAKWQPGKQDFRTLVKQSPPRPDSEPGFRLGPLRRQSGQVEEVIEEIEEIEEEEVEEAVPARPAGKASTGRQTRPLGELGNRRRPPTGAEVPAKVAIESSLSWLIRHQDEDGRWDTDGFMKHDRDKPFSNGPGKPTHDVGVTGLALLALLGNGSTLRSGPHRDQLKRGIVWLRNQQSRDGLFGGRASHDFIYSHAIATLAICEAYGLSEYKILKKSAQRGIDYLERHRNPYAVWRYQPRDNDNDVSVTSWCAMAYRAAADFGLRVNPQALTVTAAFLDQLTDSNTGHCGYGRRGQPSSRLPGKHLARFPPAKSEAMTAAGLFMRFVLGQTPARQPVMPLAADTLLASPPVWKGDGSIDFYYWYYGSYAMYQMGGKYWTTWQQAVTPALIKHQRTDGNFAGSWDPVSVWGENGGRIYATAMCALTLQATYRYRQLVEK